MRSGGAVTETARTSPAMVVVTEASMNEATAANRKRKQICQHSCAPMATSRDVHVWAGMGGHTFAPVVALSALEDPPSPPVRVGPIPGMGGAVHSRVHDPSG